MKAVGHNQVSAGTGKGRQHRCKRQYVLILIASVGWSAYHRSSGIDIEREGSKELLSFMRGVPWIAGFVSKIAQLIK